MYKILPFLFISLLFISCTSKNSAFRYFEKDDIQAKAIQNTKKIDIVKNNQTELIFWATYINNIDKKKYDLNKETFLVSVYFADSQTQDLFENSYDLSLNSQKSLSIKKIDNNDINYSNLMLKNNWGNYYLVEFEKQKDIYNFKLKLFNQNANEAQLVFEKY